MGIRFACHVCGKRLNIKRELAGRRGVCPSCSARFRIPLDDTETSAPVESRVVATSNAKWKVSEEPSGAVAVATAKRPGRVAAGSGSSIQGDIQPSAAEAIPESVLDEDDDATWYVRPSGGGQYGPASGELLKQWIQEGRVAGSALLWRDGWPQWRDAAEVLHELKGCLPGLEPSGLEGAGQDPSRPDQTALESPLEQSAPERVGRHSASIRPQPQNHYSDPRHAGVPIGGDRVGTLDTGLPRRGRSGQRITLVGILLALALMLIGVLVVVVNR